MPEHFFKRHQYTFAGIGAIAAIVGGVFTFIGNSSEKTRNTIRENSGNIIGVGDEVNLQPGAVVINEYDRQHEITKNALVKLSASDKECKSMLRHVENVAPGDVPTVPMTSLFKIDEWLDEDVIEIVGFDEVGSIRDDLTVKILGGMQALTAYAFYRNGDYTDEQIKAAMNDMRKADMGLSPNPVYFDNSMSYSERLLAAKNIFHDDLKAICLKFQEAITRIE